MRSNILVLSAAVLFGCATCLFAQSPRTRQPVPDAESLKTATVLLKRTYAKEYGAAKTDEQKIQLAKVILYRGRILKDDPAGRFVMFRTACNIASAAGNEVIAFRAIDALAQYYEVDVEVLKAVALQKLLGGKRTAEELKSIAELALKTIEARMAADQYASAESILSVLITAAKEAKDLNLRRRAEALAETAARLKSAYAIVQDSVAQLEQRPDDPALNLVGGKFYALIKADWKKGLPMLANSSDAELKKTAAADLAAAGNTEAQVSVADAWWKLAGEASGATQENLLDRAVFWYRQAVGNVSGKEQERVQERIAKRERSGPVRKSPPKYAVQFHGLHAVKTGYVYRGKTPLTIEAIVASNKIDVSGPQSILGNYRDGGMALAVRSGHWVFRCKDQNYTRTLVDQAALKLNTFDHLAGVFDGEKNVSFYVNGKRQARSDFTSPPHKVSKSAFWLGALPAVSVKSEPEHGFYGFIRGVHVCEAVLYENNFTPPKSFKKSAKSVVLYNMDSGRGKVLKDESRLARPGRIIGARWVEIPEE